MKTIAKVSLQKGMILGEDITNFRGELLFKAGTVVDESMIAKLSRHDLMVVTIMEDVDLAETHFEKVRLSQGFKEFEKTYQAIFTEYKMMMNELVYSRRSVSNYLLLAMYHQLTDSIGSNRTLLDYLYNMIPCEDELTHSHCLNSALIAGVFADWLSMKPEEKDLLILCGFYYDIGKLKLPDDLLWKPGKLTDLEFAKIKTHTMIGFDIVKDQEGLNPHIVKSILMHHERCDGNGYPSHLKMSQIDPYARYIAIIDAYEAMSSARSYRQSLTPLQIVERFEASGMLQYDYELLKPIMFKIAESQIGLTVQLSDDSKWEILMLNNLKYSRPTLKREVLDKDGNPRTELLDLYSHPELTIKAIF